MMMQATDNITNAKREVLVLKLSFKRGLVVNANLQAENLILE